MSKQDLTGSFTTECESGLYGSVLEIFYSDSFTSDELKVLLEEYSNARASLEVLECKIIKNAKHDILQNIPNQFTVQSVKISPNEQGVDYTCKCKGINIPGIDRYKKPEDVEVKELTPLQKLAKHPDIKTILNCGILTKDEKRELFGLPENKGV
jgi:hypothetical protein